jgi:3-phenylpropionate/cinnamic acid dioxygenase small subunit
LIVEYARCADARDWDAFRDIWVEDARFAVPGLAFEGRDDIVEGASGPHGLPQWDATQHLTSPPQIHIVGDTATARVNLQAIHVRDASKPHKHGDGGGRYDCEFRRTPDGWRYTSSELTPVWIVGTDLPGGPYPED